VAVELNGPRRSATLAAVTAAALFPTLATWLYFVALPGSRWTTLVFAVCKVLQFTFPLIWVLGVERSHPRLWTLPSSKGLLAGLLSGLAMLAGTVLLWELFLEGTALASRAAQAADAKLSAFGIGTVGGYILLAVFYSVFHSLLEEYYWRWFILGHLRRYVPDTAAVLLSSLAFMSHHVLVVGEYVGGYGPLTWILASSVAVCGLIWSWLYQRSHSLSGPWLSHALADAGLLWIGFGMWR
jgi:membrane protease YdiL (CAAX protease family)